MSEETVGRVHDHSRQGEEVVVSSETCTMHAPSEKERDTSRAYSTHARVLLRATQTSGHVYTYIHVHTHTYTYIHVHTHTYTYIHIHTHRHTVTRWILRTVRRSHFPTTKVSVQSWYAARRTMSSGRITCYDFASRQSHRRRQQGPSEVRIAVKAEQLNQNNDPEGREVMASVQFKIITGD